MTNFNPIHNRDQNCFEVNLDSLTAVLDYYINGDTITFTHTGVPFALEGRGVGSELVKAGLAYARANKLQVASLCWFVDKYMQRHPEWSVDESE
jgi:predicted GNAT family acetyltransferase